VVRRFCEYAVNPQYPWLERCQEEFGQVPEQVCHEWNTTRHIEEYDHRPERREISRDELRTLFDHVDDRIEQMVNANHKSAAIAWRDATMFKVQYGTGMRPFELAQLQTCDLLPHPVAPQFGTLRGGSGQVGQAQQGRDVPYARRPDGARLGR
jgi:integrase/recombinase XerC